MLAERQKEKDMHAYSALFRVCVRPMAPSIWAARRLLSLVQVLFLLSFTFLTSLLPFSLLNLFSSFLFPALCLSHTPSLSNSMSAPSCPPSALPPSPMSTPRNSSSSQPPPALSASRFSVNSNLMNYSIPKTDDQVRIRLLMFCYQLLTHPGTEQQVLHTTPAHSDRPFENATSREH